MWPDPIRVKIISGESFGELANGVFPSSIMYSSTPSDQISQAKS